MRRGLFLCILWVVLIIELHWSLREHIFNQTEILALLLVPLWFLIYCVWMSVCRVLLFILWTSLGIVPHYSTFLFRAMFVLFKKTQSVALILLRISSSWSLPVSTLSSIIYSLRTFVSMAMSSIMSLAFNYSLHTTTKKKLHLFLTVTSSSIYQYKFSTSKLLSQHMPINIILYPLHGPLHIPKASQKAIK